MSYKFAWLVSVLVALTQVHGQSHDLSLGTIGVNDRLLASITHAKAAIALTVRTSDIDYPSAGTAQPLNISAIYVKDLFTNGNGGYASVTSGGIGQKYVRLHLKTQRGNAMNFTISIYGR